MDLNDYWQANKPFVVSVGTGALVFLIAFLWLNSAFGGEAKSAEARLRKAALELRESRYGPSDLDRATEQNEALKADFEALSQAAAFEPRPEFVLQDGAGSPTNQYFLRRDEVRSDLARIAGRRRVSLPDGLGLQPLKTSSVDTITRHLEALDVLDRLLRMSIDAGVRQVTEVKVDLDSGFGSRDGVGSVERTRVTVRMVGDAEAITETLAATQTARFGKPLVIGRFDLNAAAGKQSEVRAEIELLVVRLHEVRAQEEQD